MTAHCTIQLFTTGAWRDVGSVSLFAPAPQGWRAHSYTGYDVAWAIEHEGARDAHAFTCRFPVGLASMELPHWPVFLIDLLPQGFGREEMLRRLNLPETAAEPADWPLLLAGAANPIGHLRIREAAEWLADRGGDFTEHLGAHGLFVAGSSGVQGEWPKLLLTRAADGLLYLDHTLPDAEAHTHYIVKFGRGRSEPLAEILRHEAVYMGLAQRLGLRVHAPLVLRERALFIPRFDRRVGADGVERLAQESIASLTGTAGFGTVPSHDAVCHQLVRRCTDPQAEVLEYLRRDVANLALGNKDNHARNTALQRDFRGHVALSPLFDFAPMFLHPDGIGRRMRWVDNDAGWPDWSRVLDAVCRDSEPGAQGRHMALDRTRLRDGLRQMAPVLADIGREGEAMGLSPAVHSVLRAGIESLARQLDLLR
jgi:serine/threonine-protein kinase HipA